MLPPEPLKIALPTYVQLLQPAQLAAATQLRSGVGEVQG